MTDEKTLDINKRASLLNFRKYFIITSIQILFNITQYTWQFRETYSLEANFLSVFVGTFIAFPILSLLAGVILSFVPYKDLRYKEKYITATLLSFFFLNSIVTIAFFVGLVRFIATGNIYGK